MIFYFGLALLLLLGYLWLNADSYIGYLAKLSYVLGIRIKFLEQRRWKFVPFNLYEKSRVLIVSFAGGALKIGGVPQAEFSKTLASFECDQLFLVDPTGMSWFLQGPNFNWEGIKYYESILSKFCESYSKVLFIGNCMGATGAFMMGHLADRVILFRPNIDPRNHPDWITRFGTKFIPQDKRGDIFNKILDTIEKAKETVFDIYVSKNVPDLQQLGLLPDAKNVNKLIKEGQYNIRNLKLKGELVPLIRSTYELLIGTEIKN